MVLGKRPLESPRSGCENRSRILAVLLSSALLPLCGERRLLLVRSRAPRNYNHQYLLYVLKKRLRSDLKLPLATQTLLPPPILPLRCSISSKTSLFDSSAYEEGRSGKFEQLDMPSSVSDFIEKSLIKNFDALTPYKISTLLNFYLRELDSPSLHVFSDPAFLHNPTSLAKRSQISFHAGLKALCPVRLLTVSYFLVAPSRMSVRKPCSTSC